MTVILGNKYRDTISEWEGVATGRFDYLNGCQRVMLAGSKDGKPEEFVFDVQQLVDLDGNPADSAPAKEKESSKRVGGPRSAPSRTGSR